MKIAWDRDYSVSQAKRDYERLRVNDMEVTPIVPDSGWDELRSMLIAARDDVFEQQELDGAEKLGYNFDVAYGFKLYGILSEKNGFRNRDAASDDLWNYLSIRVIPDVVHALSLIHI